MFNFSNSKTHNSTQLVYFLNPPYEDTWDYKVATKSQDSELASSPFQQLKDCLGDGYLLDHKFASCVSSGTSACDNEAF